jgi:hypothetical protein
MQCIQRSSASASLKRLSDEAARFGLKPDARHGYLTAIPFMKKSSAIVLGSALAVLVLAACESQRPVRKTGTGRFGYQGTASDTTQFITPTPTPEGYTEMPPAVDPNATPTPAPTPTPPPEPVASRDLSYGTPVPGKPGFVTSPHSPYAGYVDVRGFPPGTEVKCPYSGKIFLVP